MQRIRPALSTEEWGERRSGAVALMAVGDETHVVITDADGEVVSITGSDATFALMALANDALPDVDARKFGVTDVAICRLVMERLMALDSDPRLHSLANQLCEKVAALLPVR